MIDRLKEFVAENSATVTTGIENSWADRCLADFDAVWGVLTPQNRGRLLRAVIESVEIDEPANRVRVVIADAGTTPSTRPDSPHSEVLA